jgi:hypothetical protein
LGLRAQNTAFTYQGVLNQDAAAANGSFDFTFTLYPTNTDGIAMAGPVTNAAIAVSNGLFTTTIDFGQAFNGSSDWLEIAVQTNGGDEFITLAPRQLITAVPYAITAVTISGPLALSQLPASVLTNDADGQFYPASNVVLQAGAQFTGNAAGLTNYESLSIPCATNLVLSWNGTLQKYVITNTPNLWLTWGGGVGDACFNITVSNNLYGSLFNNPAVTWICGSNTVVTNTGCLSISAFGPNYIRAALVQP